MKISSGIMLMMLLHLTTSAQNKSPFYIEGSLSPAMHNTSFAPGFGGAFGIRFSEDHGLIFKAGEYFQFNGQNMVSSIDIGYRYHLNENVYVGSGFSHRHTIGLKHFTEGPDAALGSHDAILHQSGMMIECGYVFKGLGKRGILTRLKPYGSIQYSLMAGNSGMDAMISSSIGMRLEMGK